MLPTQEPSTLEPPDKTFADEDYLAHAHSAHSGFGVTDAMADDLGLGGTWVQTSYWTRGGIHYGSDGEPDGGTALHFNYAAIGHTWDGDGFAAPRPYPSWNLDASYIWQPPTPEPATTRTQNHEGVDYEVPVNYRWDEDTTSWVEVEVPG